MNILHWVRKEHSGLFRTTLELGRYEEKQGHVITLRQPSSEDIYYGNGAVPDVELIHSQLSPKSYHNDKPKFMWMHGEPLSSVGNKVSMTAIVDLASVVEAFICMREEEHIVWNSIRRTYLVPKGIDLEVYRPLDTITEKLSGEPSVLYIENWRGQRNPLYLCVAMQEVWKRYPGARLHLVNCNDKRHFEMFKALIDNNHWNTFIRTLSGGVKPGAINELYNKADIVVSCLYPLYARSIEAFGAGAAFISPGYSVDDYPWTCELEPNSMARAIMNCWENYDQINYRQWAEDHHDVNETVKQSIEIYGRYL
jgi:glycosyltransferase involved in cell wall biosynthesis